MDDALVFRDLINGGWRDLSFEPFRDGIDICWLMQGEPGMAVLRYAPGASVPLHRHPGLETIVVLDGAQGDERGNYPAGSVILNKPGSQHTVTSPDGCVVLICWSLPVQFLDD